MDLLDISFDGESNGEQVGRASLEFVGALGDTLLSTDLVSLSNVVVTAHITEIGGDEAVIDALNVHIKGVDHTGAHVLLLLILCLDVVGEAIVSQITHLGVEDLLIVLYGLDHVVLHGLGHLVNGGVQFVLLRLDVVALLLQHSDNFILLLL